MQKSNPKKQDPLKMTKKVMTQLQRAKNKFEKMSDTEKVDHLIENLALQLNQIIPDNKEKGLAFSKLMEVGFWLKTSIDKGKPQEAEREEGEILQISNINGSGVLEFDLGKHSISEILKKLIVLIDSNSQSYLIKNTKTEKSFKIGIGMDLATALTEVKNIVSEKYFNKISGVKTRDKPKPPSVRIISENSDKPVKPKASSIRVKKERE